MMNEEDRLAVVAYRLDNAHRTLNNIPIMLQNELWDAAMNRLYYACFYSVTALLISHGIESQTHAGARQMLGMHFVRTGKLSIKLSKFYSDLFANRQTGDYEDFVYMDKDTVEPLYPQAVEFVTAIEQLIR